MSVYTTENVTPLPAIPPSEIEGPKLGAPQEIVDRLMHYASGSVTKREMLDELLEPSGLTAGWKEGEDGWYVNELSDKNKEALVANLADLQREAQELYDVSNKKLPEIKKSIVVDLVKYGQSLGIEDPGLKETFTARIANINEVKLVAPMAQGDDFGYITQNQDEHAGLERKKGRLQISLGVLSDERVGLTTEERVIRPITHELLHGESVGALTEDGNWMVQSGIGALPELDNGNRIGHGELLLEEGSQEHIRWRHLDGASPVYEKGVMFWEAAIAANPDIEKLRFEAKFLGKNRGTLIGEIESIFGPHAVEEVESFWRTSNNILDYPIYKDKLIDMIDIHDPDPAERTKKTAATKQMVRQKLNDVQNEILSPRGIHLTDVEMIEAKANGITSAVQAQKALTESTLTAPPTTPVYRVENPNIAAHPDGKTSHEDLVGQWFSPNLNTALGYMRKSTNKSQETGQPIEGTRLVVAQVPSSDLDGFHVSRHPVASKMDVENNNYLIPRDGSIPTEEIAIDPIIAELSGQLGNFQKFSEAKQRVVMHLGDLAASH